MPNSALIHIITDPLCMGYEQPGHPERPARIRGTLDRLRRERELEFRWLQPQPVDEQVLLKAHSREHLNRLMATLDFDADTPAYPGIDEHARRSVGGALRALRCALRGQQSFSLLRPPGHHATRDRAMGFCYLNSVAIAVLAARAARIGRVAVFDFDVHHGNGTEEILLDRPGVAFFSIHQFPAYPGTGRSNRGQNCHNYPVAPGLSAAGYREVAEQALGDLRDFAPDLVAVSAGFDAYVQDPLCQQRLEVEDYHWLGGRLAELGRPMLSLLEGGYSGALPELVLAYLRGLAGLPLQTTATAVTAVTGESEEAESLWGLGDLLR